MISKVNELELEKSIERVLVGICKEDALAGEVKENNGLGYVMGQPNDFNKQYAVDEKFLFQFLELTQKDSLDAFRQYNPNDWKIKL